MTAAEKESNVQLKERKKKGEVSVTIQKNKIVSIGH